MAFLDACICPIWMVLYVRGSIRAIYRASCRLTHPMRDGGTLLCRDSLLLQPEGGVVR